MENSSKGSKVVKWVLIGVSFLFIAIMLILPLITVLTEAFKDGIKVFYQAVTDKYTVDAIVLTLEATGIAVISVSLHHGQLQSFSLKVRKF